VTKVPRRVLYLNDEEVAKALMKRDFSAGAFGPSGSVTAGARAAAARQLPGGGQSHSHQALSVVSARGGPVRDGGDRYPSYFLCNEGSGD
jgi:hypothetical protein